VWAASHSAAVTRQALMPEESQFALAAEAAIRQAWRPDYLEVEHQNRAAVVVR